MNFSKKDIVIAFSCVLFLIINMGAIGNAGSEKAMETVCMSNLKQWGDLFQLWLNDHDGNFMSGRDKWFYALAPYAGMELRNTITPREYKLRFCPTAMSFGTERAD